MTKRKQCTSPLRYCQRTILADQGFYNYLANPAGNGIYKNLEVDKQPFFFVCKFFAIYDQNGCSGDSKCDSVPIFFLLAYFSGGTVKNGVVVRIKVG